MMAYVGAPCPERWTRGSSQRLFRSIYNG